MAEKLTRLKTRLGDPEWRRYGKLLFAGDGDRRSAARRNAQHGSRGEAGQVEVGAVDGDVAG